MTERNEKSVNFHEFLTLRRDRERRRVVEVNQLNRNQLSRSRLDLSHSREALQDQDKQSQSLDDDEKSIKMQR
jgi:hypothetical protein